MEDGGKGEGERPKEGMRWMAEVQYTCIIHDMNVYLNQRNASYLWELIESLAWKVRCITTHFTISSIIYTYHA